MCITSLFGTEPKHPQRRSSAFCKIPAGLFWPTVNRVDWHILPLFWHDSLPAVEMTLASIIKTEDVCDGFQNMIPRGWPIRHHKTQMAVILMVTRSRQSWKTVRCYSNIYLTPFYLLKFCHRIYRKLSAFSEAKMIRSGNRLLWIQKLLRHFVFIAETTSISCWTEFNHHVRSQRAIAD